MTYVAGGVLALTVLARWSTGVHFQNVKRHTGKLVVGPLPAPCHWSVGIGFIVLGVVFKVYTMVSSTATRGIRSAAPSCSSYV